VEEIQEQTRLIVGRGVIHRLTRREMAVRAWADHPTVYHHGPFEHHDGVGGSVSVPLARSPGG
jgi:hypothetical protein